MEHGKVSHDFVTIGVTDGHGWSQSQVTVIRCHMTRVT